MMLDEFNTNYGFKEKGLPSDRQQGLNDSQCSVFNVPRNSISGRHTLITSSLIEKNIKQKEKKFSEQTETFARALSERLRNTWIERVFLKRECIYFIPTDNPDRCGCGRLVDNHENLFSKISIVSTSSSDNLAQESTPLHWSLTNHTRTYPTDAYGTLEFLGGAHAHKAHYVRLGFDSDPADIMYMMEKVWQLETPRLVISVHGGASNFDIDEKLGRVFREGLLKAALTTGAWIITAGTDSGVVRHVAAALDEAGISARMRSKITTIGIAPWGMLKRREKLIGKDIVIPYDPHAFASKNRYVTLNDRHSYFLLVDNGTSGRYGADIVLRKRFEKFLAEKSYISPGDRRVPLVSVVLEGGTNTIKAVHHYLTRFNPPVPVIVCDRSGRASDLLSFVQYHYKKEGTLSATLRTEILALITKIFSYNEVEPEALLEEIIQIVKCQHLLTIFRLGEDKTRDVDRAILMAVLKGQTFSSADQLALVLSWNRVDIARSDIFIAGHQWSTDLLYNAMMDALLLNRVEFVKLLLENGVSMKKFLSIERLEQLYNKDEIIRRTLERIIRKKFMSEKPLTLLEIGLAVEKWMGNAYKSLYTCRMFKSRYDERKLNLSSQIRMVSSFRNLRSPRELIKFANYSRKMEKITRKDSSKGEGVDFNYPFNELMLWAVLTQRKDMAYCMFLYGEEAMAKALLAIRIYKCLSKEIEKDFLEIGISKELKACAEFFKRESLDLLDHCYQQNDINTIRLLTANLDNWGHQTCLSLAVIANHKEFIAHPCCQILLADLWHGGLGMRSIANASCNITTGSKNYYPKATKLSFE